MQTETAPRIAPLLPSAWDDTILDALGTFPKSLEFVLSKWNAGGADARGMNALGLLAHHPPLAKVFMAFNAHVASASTLATRVREICILRIGWLRRAEYEFVQHIILGKRAGLSDLDIELIQQGPNAPGWDSIEVDIVRAVDELYADASITQPTWDRLLMNFSPVQIMDLIFLVGFYDVLGMAIKSFGIPLEHDVAPLDPVIRDRMMNQSGPIR